MNLARVLSDEVAAQGLTQAALGRMCGMSTTRVGVSLRGERTMYVEEVRAMCAALGLDFLDVITEALEGPLGS